MVWMVAAHRGAQAKQEQEGTPSSKNKPGRGRDCTRFPQLPISIFPERRVPRLTPPTSTPVSHPPTAAPFVPLRPPRFLGAPREGWTRASGGLGALPLAAHPSPDPLCSTGSPRGVRLREKRVTRRFACLAVTYL